MAQECHTTGVEGSDLQGEERGGKWQANGEKEEQEVPPP